MRGSNHSSLRCLLDDDADAVRLARNRRLRSLTLSVSLQALFITVVVVAPLLATGKLQLQTQPPVIVFRGRPEPYQPQRQSGSQQSSRRHSTSILENLVQPARIPAKVPTVFEDPPQIGEPGPKSCVGCSPNGQIDPPPWLTGADKGPRPAMPDVKAPAPTRPVRVTGPIQEARLINRVDPTYPVLCKQMRLEGSLVVRAIIGRDGEMRELNYVSGNPCFLQNSMDAISKWRYRPTILNGEPVEVETTITVVFKLNR